MKTLFRDNAIAKNHLLFKLTLLWAMSSTLIAIALAFFCFYALIHKQTHWLPVCLNHELSIGDSAYSPEYLKEMTQKIADLRLTYNPETIDSHYISLSHLIESRHVEAFIRVLDAERETVKKKNISSVFYVEQIRSDVAKSTAFITGSLVRTSHGLQLKPQHKTYQLQFSFHNGMLWLQSIKEINNEKTR